MRMGFRQRRRWKGSGSFSTLSRLPERRFQARSAEQRPLNRAWDQSRGWHCSPVDGARFGSPDTLCPGGVFSAHLDLQGVGFLGLRTFLPGAVIDQP